METRPRVTVYIPSVGRVELSEAIDSALSQDLRDIEVIVCSCGKHDEVAKLVQEKNDTRLRHTQLPEGVPLNGTFDHAVRQAKGDFVFMLDDDNALLPGSLSLMVKVAEKTGADFIAGSHVYFYDKNHGRHYLRNSMGVLPFTGEVKEFNPMRAIKALFSFERIGPRHEIPRLHPSALLVSREVVERAHANIGTIMIAELPNGLSSQPILLSQATKSVALDYPVVVVGRLGISMSQVWSTAARKRFRTAPFPLEGSPVVGHTRINGTLANYLWLKNRKPEIYKDAPIDYVMFARIYLQELRYLDMDFSLVIPAWKNLFSFLRTLPEGPRKELLRKAFYSALLYPIVFLSRRLKMHTLWRSLKATLFPPHTPTAKESFDAKREFSIPLSNYPDTVTIGDTARDALFILKKEVGDERIPSPHI